MVVIDTGQLAIVLVTLLPGSRVGLTVDVQQLGALLAHKTEDGPQALAPDGGIAD